MLLGVLETIGVGDQLIVLAPNTSSWRDCVSLPSKKELITEVAISVEMVDVPELEELLEDVVAVEVEAVEDLIMKVIDIGVS